MLFDCLIIIFAQKAKKLVSCVYDAFSNLKKSLPRALSAILLTPYRGKFQKIWSDLRRGRGFRAQGCAHGCEMHTNGIFDKDRCFLTTGHRHSSSKTRFCGSKMLRFFFVDKNPVLDNYQRHPLRKSSDIYQFERYM